MDYKRLSRVADSIRRIQDYELGDEIPKIVQDLWNKVKGIVPSLKDWELQVYPNSNGISIRKAPSPYTEQELKDLVDPLTEKFNVYPRLVRSFFGGDGKRYAEISIFPKDRKLMNAIQKSLKKEKKNSVIVGFDTLEDLLMKGYDGGSKPAQYYFSVDGVKFHGLVEGDDFLQWWLEEEGSDNHLVSGSVEDVEVEEEDNYNPEEEFRTAVDKYLTERFGKDYLTKASA